MSRITPAQLSFLAIYNPSLGRTDETFRDQVVFYYSRTARDRRKTDRHGTDKAEDVEREAREEENEKLRQIGLAQGIIDFARGFASEQPVEHVETERKRIVMREVEGGWWLLASIDLTRLPAAIETDAKRTLSPAPDAQPEYEYSAREVSPPALLIEQLLRAHRIFRLHHGPSLSSLYDQLQRTKFCSTLERYWTRFANNWDVLLHGNPAAEVYHGVKLSSGGELGIGVGEEEWGSGEREVFEDFAGRTDGLVDMVVSRFGEPSPGQMSMGTKSESANKAATALPQEPEPWLARATDPGPADGVVFSGTGAITRSSLCDVSDWLQQIYVYGEHAYGVRDNPRSARTRRRRKDITYRQAKEPQKPREDKSEEPRPESTPRRARSREYPSIPPPILSAVERSLERASAAAEAEQNVDDSAEAKSTPSQTGDGWTKYLTLGYGSTWGPASTKRPEVSRQPSDLLVKKRDGGGSPPQQRGRKRAESEMPQMMRNLEPEPEDRRVQDRIRAQVNAENSGYFIVGLKGSLEDDADAYDDESGEGSEWNSRTLVRTLHLELNKPLPPSRLASNESDAIMLPTTRGGGKLTRLRVVVYVHRPFVYAFLFNQRAESLSMAAFYRNLHTFFAPLHKPLSNSTDPAKVAARIAAAASSTTTTTSASSTAANAQQPIYDLVYDPTNLTMHTSIPNIPEPGTLSAEGLAEDSGWTRVEAINVHSQILATVAETRSANAADQLERTAKTSRGWWFIWMRVFAGIGQPMQGEELAQDTTAEETINDLRLDSLQQSVKTIERADGREDSAWLQAAPSATASALSNTTLAPGDSASNTSAHDQAAEHDMIVPEPLKQPNPSTTREAVLIRRARDASLTSGSKSGVRNASGMWATMGLGGTSSSSSLRAGGQQAGWGPARLAEGIGVDARRYVEGLLSLNR